MTTINEMFIGAIDAKSNNTVLMTVKYRNSYKIVRETEYSKEVAVEVINELKENVAKNYFLQHTFEILISDINTGEVIEVINL